MKEWLSKIEPVDYDRIVYPRMVMGHEVGIRDMFTDDILIQPNPEKYQFPDAEKMKVEAKPLKHPLQGEFLLTRRIKLKPLRLAEVPRGHI